jgi:hypothetical protein
MAIWCILWQLGIFFPFLVFGCTKKILANVSLHTFQWFSSVADPVDISLRFNNQGRPTGEADILFGR